MRTGAFELSDPVPKLKKAQAFTTLSPWIDVGEVGSAALQLLEAHFKASELGKLGRPGTFYDFTRYRPTISLVRGRRLISVPNTLVTYSKAGESGDFVFINCLEPHAMGEIYVKSTLQLLERLNVKRYCLLGGMYDSVPHTRPLIVTGGASESALERKLKEANVKTGGYQGPTTINILISEQATKLGIATTTLIVHLPHYIHLERDYLGQYTLLSLVCYLYDLSIDLSQIKRRGEEQYRRISQAIDASPEARELVKALETGYDEGLEASEKPELRIHLSPEVEKFLKEMEKRFGLDL
jgi:hypothetical protein